MTTKFLNQETLTQAGSHAITQAIADRVFFNGGDVTSISWDGALAGGITLITEEVTMMMGLTHPLLEVVLGALIYGFTSHKFKIGAFRDKFAQAMLLYGVTRTVSDVVILPTVEGFVKK